MSGELTVPADYYVDSRHSNVLHLFNDDEMAEVWVEVQPGRWLITAIYSGELPAFWAGTFDLSRHELASLIVGSRGGQGWYVLNGSDAVDCELPLDGEGFVLGFEDLDPEKAQAMQAAYHRLQGRLHCRFE